MESHLKAHNRLWNLFMKLFLLELLLGPFCQLNCWKDLLREIPRPSAKPNKSERRSPIWDCWRKVSHWQQHPSLCSLFIATLHSKHKIFFIWFRMNIKKRIRAMTAVAMTETTGFDGLMWNMVSDSSAFYFPFFVI